MLPLSNLLRSAADTCPLCHDKAGILNREHSQCRRIFNVGWQETVKADAQVARTHTFGERALRLTLAEIARRSYGDGATVNQALEEG